MVTKSLSCWEQLDEEEVLEKQLILSEGRVGLTDGSGGLALT